MKKIAKVYKYTVIIEPQQPRGLMVSVPALPGCSTQAETIEEALAMAKDAIEGYLDVLEEENLEIPEERGAIISDVEIARLVRV
jgi:predicted RNase H-like HicB family nuclease